MAGTMQAQVMITGTYELFVKTLVTATIANQPQFMAAIIKRSVLKPAKSW